MSTYALPIRLLVFLESFIFPFVIPDSVLKVSEFAHLFWQVYFESLSSEFTFQFTSSL
jgi:hypothetical protein